MKFNSKPIKSASLIQSSLIQTISESEASSISGGVTQDVKMQLRQEFIDKR